MGNASSSNANRASAAASNSPRQESPGRSSRRSRSVVSQAFPRPQSPSPLSLPDAQAQQQHTHRPIVPHRSLRSKKKSLELPDLASLSLTPASSHNSSPHGGYRRPQPSSPIAIPPRIGNQPSANSPRLTTIPSIDQQMADVIVDSPSNQLPVYNNHGRGHTHIRGAPLQYNSTRSFAGRASNQSVQPFVTRGHPNRGFIPETVASTIPLALKKAEIEKAEQVERMPGSAEEREPTSVCIVWRGGGKAVQLIRAGDNNWKARQTMTYDEGTNTFQAWVSLQPGTHHIRFIVDGVSTCAEELPTAVDDQGSLANYVAVPISGYTPPSATLHPTPRREMLDFIPQSENSFFAASDRDSLSGESPLWTTQTPWQLECAAEEEEQWLTHGQQARSLPPQHPQAPSLPRHLEKLIMNHKPPGMSRHHSSSRGSHSALAMTPSTAALPAVARGTLPVTTASGTNIAATPQVAAGDKPAFSKLDSTGVADDNSVLPVPSHVVLQHLGTSAIRNGVLAMSDTTRYRKKYITTIFYKPT